MKPFNRYLQKFKKMNDLKFILNSFAVNITLNNFNFNRGRRIYIGKREKENLNIYSTII